MQASDRRYGTLLGILGCILLLVSAQTLADARSDGERGIAEYRKGNLIESLSLLESAAAGGYTPAQTTLAFILDASEQDEKAFHWYQQAAEAGDANGLFGLGSMYAKGEGTERNPQRAADLFREAAELGHAEAMWVYANALENGLLGLDRRADEALIWYEQAAGKGDAQARARLSRALDKGELGLDGKPDYAAALRKRIQQDD